MSKKKQYSQKVYCSCRERFPGIKLQHWDGHKHVDLYIEKAKHYIEIDGLNHWLNPKQILSDFNRDHYSDKDGYRTFRIPSFVVLTESRKLARAIDKINNNYTIQPG